MKTETALYLLRRSPEEFLANTLLILAGVGASGETDLAMGRLLAQPVGVGAPNEAFRASASGFVPGADDIRMPRAHNVRMIPSAEDLDLAAIPGYVIDGHGADILMTGQLTKCSFVIRNIGGGAVCVAHIEPGGVHPSSDNLRTDILATGQFAGHAGALDRVFGYDTDYTPCAYVVGVRRNAIWEIYAQRVSATGSKGHIQGVDRLF